MTDPSLHTQTYTHSHEHTHTNDHQLNQDVLSNTLLRINVFEGKSVLQWTRQDCYHWAINEVFKINPQPDAAFHLENFLQYNGCDLVKLTCSDFCQKLCQPYGRELYNAFQELVKTDGLNVHSTTATSSYPQDDYFNMTAFDYLNDELFEGELLNLNISETIEKDEENEENRIKEERYTQEGYSLPNLQDLSCVPLMKQEITEMAATGGGGGGADEWSAYTQGSLPLRQDHSSSSPLQPSYSSQTYDNSYSEGYCPNGETFTDINSSSFFSTYSFPSPTSSSCSSTTYSASTPPPLTEDDDRGLVCYTPPNEDWEEFQATAPHSSTPKPRPPRQAALTHRRGSNTPCATTARETSGPLAQLNTSSRRRSRGPKNWEFIARLLVDPTSNPSLLEWVDHGLHTFKFNKPQDIAVIWGQRSGKGNLTYDNFARGLRYHYKTGALIPVQEKQLVYRCGKKMINFLKELTGQ